VRNKKVLKESRKFYSKNSYWLDDFALFTIIKRKFNGQEWSQWPKELADAKSGALGKIKRQYRDTIEKEKFFQYLFFKQWLALKKYANQKGIQIIGDIPIYVSYDSVEVWKNPKIFKLDKSKNPVYVAGVPPDYFSETGQRWGNPVYDWAALRKTKYKWWIQRMAHNLKLFDMVRVDHFRGLVAFWQISSNEATAINGKWIKVPTKDFFSVLSKSFKRLPLIAEDLGIITLDVKKTIARLGFPGMRVLLFAFGENNPKHPYLPNNFIQNCVVYTGTHDNNTARGWFENEAEPQDKKRLFNYLGRQVSPDEIHLELIKLALTSRANFAIIPMQDVLGLPCEYRMNLPGTINGNWKWRLLPGQITHEAEKLLGDLTIGSGRAKK